MGTKVFTTDAMLESAFISEICDNYLSQMPQKGADEFSLESRVSFESSRGNIIDSRDISTRQDPNQ